MIAFKWSLQEKLPSMSGLSYVELTMCLCVVVFLIQAVLITIRDLYLYRYGMGHPEDVTSYCRVLGGGLIWWYGRTDINFYNDSTKTDVQWYVCGLLQFICDVNASLFYAQHQLVYALCRPDLEPFFGKKEINLQDKTEGVKYELDENR